MAQGNLKIPQPLNLVKQSEGQKIRLSFIFFAVHSPLATLVDRPGLTVRRVLRPDRFYIPLSR